METAKWIIAFVGLLGIGGFLADVVVWETARQQMKNPFGRHMRSSTF
jgi:hypothetical protein